MTEVLPTIEHMHRLLDGWERAGDRRGIFLSCYAQMTGNMLKAVQAGEFHDNAWVGKLLEHFAGYYFNALDGYELQPQAAPAVWQAAFETARDPQAHVLQHLMLGVNAHINYDLVFALEDVLRPDWQVLSPQQRTERYEDHCRVNLVIAETVDAVQDSVVERFAPKMDLLDDGLGPLDEWLVSKLISIYRDRVWQQSIHRLQAADESEADRLRQIVEKDALERARSIQQRRIQQALQDLLSDFI
jgi:hypothetical protein